MTREEWLADLKAKISSAATALTEAQALLAQPIPDPAPPPTPVLKPIFMYIPNALTAETLAKYGTQKIKVFYQSRFDDNPQDGVLDSDWQNSLADIPLDYTGNVDFDWESDEVNQGFLKDLYGRNGVTEQSAALAQAVKLITFYKTARPKAKWSFYDLPYGGGAYSIARDATDTLPTWWHDAEVRLKPLWDLVDHLLPSVYLPYQLGVDQSYENNDKRNRNYIAHCKRCAPGKPVYPYMSQVFWNSAKTYHNQPIPPEMIYRHADSLVKAGADGFVLWGSSSMSGAKESTLKALRQALNGEPYVA